MEFTKLLRILCIFTLLLSASHTFAQGVDKTSAEPESLGQRHIRSMQILEEIQKNISVSTQQQNKLSDEISLINTDRTALNQKLITATTNSRNLERKIQRNSVRITELERTQSGLRTSLLDKTSLLSEVLAALQRMGRNPPPALLVTPKDALISVRSAILLGSVVPEIRTQTQILATELGQLVSLGEEIEKQRVQLAKDLKTEAQEERHLSTLITEKKRRANIAQDQLASQRLKAAELAARETSLAKLIARLETEIEAVNQASKAARNAEIELEKRQSQQIATARKETANPDFSDASRISPAVKFEQARGHLLKPVNGVEIRKFAARDELGDPSPGVSIATRVDARVISPADGWVVYSGPFRSYGQLIILNVGSNYHIVMSGMNKTDVELGQFVLVGEPVGKMGPRRIASAGTIDIGSSRPVLSVEIRKNSEPIDPAPWWQITNEKRSNDDS